MDQLKHASQERAFASLQVNERPPKPRTRGVTEIRGPYYAPMGKHYLQDILETMDAYVDVLKFAGGSLSLMPQRAVKNRAVHNTSSNILFPENRWGGLK